MFTWMPIHEETARRLLDFKDKQEELVAIQRDMAATGIGSLKYTDIDERGNEMPLTVMDPWTFFAGFNRGITNANRIAGWALLKKRWSLASPVPADFEGLPVANNQRAWSFPYAHWLPYKMRATPDAWASDRVKHRDPQHLPTLWAFFEQLMNAELDVGLMDRCLHLWGLRLPSLTMGLFWFQPTRFFPCEGKSQQKAARMGVTLSTEDADGYVKWCADLRAKGVTDIPVFSRDAHYEAQGSDALSSYPLSQASFEELAQLFAEDCPDFVSFAQPGERFAADELRLKHRMLERFAREKPQLEQLIQSGQGLEALKVLQRNLTGNMVSPYAWKNTFGDTDERAAATLEAYWKVATEDEPDWAAFFHACHEAKTTAPNWDALGQVLWALDPQRFFPIKISVLRELADYCGQALPGGRPAADTLPAVLKFGEAFRAKLAPWQPRDMTDVQSWMWHVNGLGEFEDEEGENQEPPESASVLREEPPAVIAPSSSKPRLWLIAPGERGRYWEDWQAREEISIGWDHLGDLSAYATGKDIIKELQAQSESEVNQAFNGWAIWSFYNDIKPGDYVVAKRGRTTLLGYGIVTGGYRYDETRVEHTHLHSVQWKEVREVDISALGMLPMKTLTDIQPGWMTHRALQEHYGVQLPGWRVLESLSPTIPAAKVKHYTLRDAMDGLFMAEDEVTRLIDTLQRKKNLILQGPPGVGKTFIARRLAYLAMQEHAPERVAMVQFHPSYAYEDFIQGLRPTKQGGFELREGLFLKFCRRAQVDPARDYVFIIDEINRGNLGKIFGELMLLIERDKRGSAHAIPLAAAEDEDDTFFVPENVHIIGLMNTADRSLALVDYALRRRFAFATLRPGFDRPAFTEHLEGLGAKSSLALRIVQRLGALNEAIRDNPHLGADFVIGHSFFTPMAGCTLDDAWFEDIIQHEVAPLLAEYWLDDPGQEKVKALVADLLA